MQITEQQAHAIWDILVEHVGAPESGRGGFVDDRDAITEYRFSGLLGFGGKFWNSGGRWYVTCYPEDETEGRRLLIQEANERLAELLLQGK